MSAKTTDNLNKALWAVFAVYIAATLYGITFHEQWRDEAQSWLVVKNLDLIGLFKKLPSEGHPPSWYLLLFPFVKLGLPYVIQNILSTLLMIGAVYIFLFRTKLHIVLKLLLPFSYLFFYEYPIIGRSYGLLTMLAALVVYLYPKRYEKPWLYALCVVALLNTHMLVFSFGMMLAGIFLYDALKQKRTSGNIIGAGIFMLIGGLYLIPYIAMSDVNRSFTPFVANHGERVAQSFDYGLFTYAAGNLGALLFLAICATYYKNIRAILLLVGGVASAIYILSYAFPGDIRHAGIVFVVVVTALGIAAWNDAPAANMKVLPSQYAHILLAIAVLAQLKQSVQSYLGDKDNIYSDSRNAAEFLKDNNLDKSIIVGHYAWAASALLPYFPSGREFYYVECQRYGSYYVFDTCFEKGYANKPPEHYLRNTYQIFNKELDKVVMIFNYQLPRETSAYLDLLYSSEEAALRRDEMYYIYKFKKQ